MMHQYKIRGLVVLVSLFVFLNTVYAEKKEKVQRAIFTTKIVDREPIDQVLVLNNNSKEVSFFTDLRHFDNQIVTHKWIYNNKTESVIRFKVKGPRWRVYSTYNIKPTQLGKWSVIVQNDKGISVKASVFRLVDKLDEQVILPKP